MEQKTKFAPVFEFKQEDFPQHLHLSDGTLYVEASTIGKIKAALESGYLAPFRGSRRSGRFCRRAL